VVNEEADTAILEFTGDTQEHEEILTALEALGMQDFARAASSPWRGKGPEVFVFFYCRLGI